MSELVKKPEKIASAMYLITSFFSDLEPLKWKLRTLASDLVTMTVSLKERQIDTSGVRELVSKIIGLLIVAKDAGLISDMNHDLMQREFTKYLEMFDSPGDISRFLIEESHNLSLKDSETKSNVFIKDKKISAPLLEDKGHLPMMRESHLKDFGAISVKKNSRQSIIISILKRKREIMIKDISPLIDDCGEKTIQRELSTMVQNGLIRKTGEKRWSRYRLA